MKNGAKQILGKTVAGVRIIKRRERSPQAQLQIYFDDDTHFEFYCMDGDIHQTGGLNKGDPRREPVNGGEVNFEEYL